MKTYLLPITVEPDDEEAGYWYAEVPIIRGCALSCYPLEHVLDSIQDTAQVMLEIMVECGDPLPEGIEKYETDPAASASPGGEVIKVIVCYP